MLGFSASDDLISRIIRAESAGNPNAVSPAGAIGLMQIMPETARDPGFGVSPVYPSQLRDPEINQRFGTEYYNAMLNRYGGDEVAAAAAYNAGPGVADRFVASGKDPSTLPAETRNYIKTIFGGDMPQSLALEQASFTGQSPGDRGSGQIPQGALGFSQSLPPAPSVTNMPQVQAPAPVQNSAPSQSLIPTFQDNPIGAIALVLEEFTGSLQGKPSKFAQLKKLQIQQRQVELQEQAAGREIYKDALEIAKSGGLQAGFSMIDGSALDDSTKGEFKNFLRETVRLGQERAAQITGLLESPSAQVVLNNICGLDVGCYQEHVLDPKKRESLVRAADRHDLPLVNGIVDAIVEKLPKDQLAGLQGNGIGQSEFNQLLEGIHGQAPDKFPRNFVETAKRNAQEILESHGILVIPSDKEVEIEVAKRKDKGGKADFQNFLLPDGSRVMLDLSTEEGRQRAQQLPEGTQKYGAAVQAKDIKDLGFANATEAKDFTEARIATETVLNELDRVEEQISDSDTPASLAGPIARTINSAAETVLELSELSGFEDRELLTKEYSFDVFGETAPKSAALRSNLINLAYLQARAAEPGARQLAEGDIQRQLDRLGGNSGKGQMRAALAEIRRGVKDNFRIRHKVFEERGVDVGPLPEMFREQEAKPESKNVVQRFNKPAMDLTAEEISQMSPEELDALGPDVLDALIEKLSK